MASLVLTPQKAFKAIHELKLEGKRLTGRAVWQRCGQIGSVSTAVRWLKVAEAITQGSKEIDDRLVSLWQAVTQGEPFEDDQVDDESFGLPNELLSIIQHFSARISITLQSLVEKEVDDIHRTAAQEIERAEKEAEENRERRELLDAELVKREAEIALLRDDFLYASKENTACEARIEELERQVARSEERHASIEAANCYLSEQFGQTSERSTHLEERLMVATKREAAMEDEIVRCQRELHSTQHQVQEGQSKAILLERENAVLEARLNDLNVQLSHHREERREIEQRASALAHELAQKTGETSVLIERNAQYELRLVELQNELNQMRLRLNENKALDE